MLSSGDIGDIWSCGAFSDVSPLKEILDSGEYTIDQLLAEDELLQELKGMNSILVDFFSSPIAVTQLIRYVVDRSSSVTITQASISGDKSFTEPSTKLLDPEFRSIRFPYMSCEVICCELGCVIDTIVDSFVCPETSNVATHSIPRAVIDDNEDVNVEVVDLHTPAVQDGQRILDLLFSIVYDEQALDDYRAGYFEKILRVLFKKRGDSMADYINTNGSQLLPALLRHLYSNSILQIVQRLLLPRRPTLKKAKAITQGDQMDGDLMHQIVDSIILVEGCEEIDDSDPAFDSNAGEIKSDLSMRPEAPELLLNLLMNSNAATTLEVRLNAAEVLITMIQSSLLSSTIMLTLTESSIMERLVVAASTICDDRFSPHESPTTACMSVLESLILQLGGYGSVGSDCLLDDVANSTENVQEANVDAEDLCNHQISTLSAKVADMTALVEHLPKLLNQFSLLLTHPVCEEWKSPTQFSKDVPVRMLGSSRLRIVRVLESLVLLGDREVDVELVHSDCLEHCLNLFWEFQWCSMLHQSVANLLVHVLEGQNMRVEMQEYFLIRCNLLVRLMDSFADPTNVLHTSNIEASADESPTDDAVTTTSPDNHVIEQVSVSKATVITKSNEKHPIVDKDSSSLVKIAASPPSQSFRFGYMGHVIIICQALVHACSTVDELNQATMTEGETPSVTSTPPQEQLQHCESTDSGDPLSHLDASVLGNLTVSEVPQKDPILSERSSQADDDSTAASKEPLYLAEMVACHPLSEVWNEFVATTVATETTIQSTPLGGFNVSALANGMLMQQRPGLADDGDDMGLDPPSRLRDVLDMDENDLEVAATMMAGFTVSARTLLIDDDEASGESNQSYNSGEARYSTSSGYLFDDPLGRMNGGLGIELGKLAKYRSENGSTLDDFVNNEEHDDDDCPSDHSSDEELDHSGTPVDVPLMDLFVGNFNAEFPSASEECAAVAEQEQQQDWSNFANFDDAFTDSSNAESSNTLSNNIDFDSFEQPFDNSFNAGIDSIEKKSKEKIFSTSKMDLEEIFGSGDHAELLILDASLVSPPSIEAIVTPNARVEPTHDHERLTIVKGFVADESRSNGATSTSGSVVSLPHPGSDPTMEEIEEEKEKDNELELAPSDELKADVLSSSGESLSVVVIASNNGET